MKESTVEKGIAFEKLITNKLNSLGFTAVRTNQINDVDTNAPKNAFDGGVDIIATYKYVDPDSKVEKFWTFYIQCKNQKNDAVRHAVQEVYTGMGVRQVVSKNNYGVVIAATDTTDDTREYARLAGIELLLAPELEVLQGAKVTKRLSYRKGYGAFFKVLAYCVTKDRVWIDNMEFKPLEIHEISTVQNYKDDAMLIMDRAEAHNHTASRYEAIADKEREKATDIIRTQTYNVLNLCEELEKALISAGKIDLVNKIKESG